MATTNEGLAIAHIHTCIHAHTQKKEREKKRKEKKAYIRQGKAVIPYKIK